MLKTYYQTFDEPEFNERISNNIKGSVKIMLIGWLIYLFVNWIIKGLVIFEGFGFQIMAMLGYILFFIPYAIYANRKSNRFLIKKLSFDDSKIYIDYFEYDRNMQVKLPLRKVKIKLVQYRNTNNIYLKISIDELIIKQYRGTGWGANELREIFKALKEAQKRLEV